MCLLSCKYGFRDLISRFSLSAFALAARLRKIPWYCFAFTYTGSSSISLGSIMRALCWSFHTSDDIGVELKGVRWS